MDSSWRDKIEHFKIPIALSLIGIILIIGGIVSSNLLSGTKDYPKESLVTPKQISVDVSGAVSKPGVYQLNTDSRVEDAIKAAGGLGGSANREYVSKYLNMAQKISDGAKIYVPFVGDQVPAGAVSAGSVAGVNSGPPAGRQVNINTGTQAELEALPGIGPVTASKVITGRPYQKVEDLLNQKIVSKSVFEKIKDSLVIY